MTGRTQRGEREPLSGQKLRVKALDLLSRRDHSEKELEQKLRSRGAPAGEISELFDKLRERGLLDDRRFAENFLSGRARRAWGTRRYRQELISRGVDADIVDESLSSSDFLEVANPQEKLARLVVKELAKGKTPDKIGASMVRRGFAHSDIKKAIEACALENDELER